MSLYIKDAQPIYALTWQDKKGDKIEALAPNMDEIKELFLWLAQQTGMKT